MPLRLRRRYIASTKWSIDGGCSLAETVHAAYPHVQPRQAGRAERRDAAELAKICAVTVVTPTPDVACVAFP